MWYIGLYYKTGGWKSLKCVISYLKSPLMYFYVIKNAVTRLPVSRFWMVLLVHDIELHVCKNKGAYLNLNRILAMICLYSFFVFKFKAVHLYLYQWIYLEYKSLYFTDCIYKMFLKIKCMIIFRDLHQTMMFLIICFFLALVVINLYNAVCLSFLYGGGFLYFCTKEIIDITFLR